MPQSSWSKICEAGRSFFYLAAREQTSWLLILFLVAAMASASAQTGATLPNVETIMAREVKDTELVADGSSAQANFFEPMLDRSLRRRVIPRLPK